MTQVPRQALVIGVSRFGPPSADDEETELVARNPLPYAADLATKLAGALSRLGYAGTLLTAPEDTTADQIGRRVRGTHRDLLDASGIRVVCVLSHGEPPQRTEGLMIIGSDDRPGDTNVRTWLGDIEDLPNRHPTTLFLLDVCHAGLAARLPWQLTHADGSNRAWVIAASEPPRKAYDGRFSRALIQVLTEVADGALDINPSFEFVPFDTVAKAVARRVIDLSAGMSRQRVTASVLDQSISVDLAFFPNPHYRGTVRARVDAALAVFPDELDPGLDPGHFTSRAAGLGPVLGLSRTGHFHGRKSQREALTPWMNRLDDTDSVRVITGTPGTGKSALLGVLVCAAHPKLRGQTRYLWERLQPNVPSMNTDLVAVHARERSIAVIVGSITRQLASSPSTSPDGAASWSLAGLLDILRAREDPPLVVVDALDEAVDANQVVHDLLVPLIRARRSDGRPSVQLLVGTRTGPQWPQIDPLLAATTAGQVIDLDNDTPPEVLRNDLTDYLDDLLSARAPYEQAKLADIRGSIAAGVADRLVETKTDNQQWGEFLVAGLFTHHLLTLTAPPTTSGQVDELLADLPTTLPAVLEMDLAARPDDDLARPLLTALAHVKGDGIPLTLLTTLVPQFTSSGQPLTDGAIMTALATNRFYLRFSIDTDGTSLYRLFHQGLADHLLESTLSVSRIGTASAILDKLLSTVRVTDRRRRWDLADPYLWRHVLQHADDAERVGEMLTDYDLLVYAMPDVVLSLRDRMDPDSRLICEIYRTAYQPGRWNSTRTRRFLLAVEAARFRASWNAEWCNQPSDEQGAGWEPVWATGSRVSASAPAILTEVNALAVACTELDGRPVAVTGGADRTVRVWDLATGTAVGHPLAGHAGSVTAVACTELFGHVVVVSAALDRTVRVWDLTTGTPVGRPLVGDTIAVTAVACTELFGRPVAVTTGGNGTVRVWDLVNSSPISHPLFDHIDRAAAVACPKSSGWPAAVIGGWDGTVRVWDLATGTSVGRPLIGHTGPVRAVACTELQGRSIAVTGSWDGTVRVWDLASGSPVGRPLIGHTGPVRAVACAELQGLPTAVTTGGDETVRVWDLVTGARLGDPLTGHTGPVRALSCINLRGRPIAVTTGDDRTVRVWGLATGPWLSNRLTGHTKQVTAVACTELDGRSVAVTAGADRTVRVWDLATGTTIGHTLAGHIGPVRAVACTELDGRPVAVTTGDDRTVRVWDLTSGTPVGDPLTGHTGPGDVVACTEVNGRPVAVSAGWDGTVRVWDLATGTSVGEPLSGWVNAMACTTVGGRSVAVTGSIDGLVRMWDLATGNPLEGVLSGHAGAVRAVACTELDGRHVSVTTGKDAMVRLWDLESHAELCAPADLPEPGQAIQFTSTGDVILGFGWDIAVLRTPALARTSES